MRKIALLIITFYIISKKKINSPYQKKIILSITFNKLIKTKNNFIEIDH